MIKNIKILYILSIFIFGCNFESHEIDKNSSSPVSPPKEMTIYTDRVSTYQIEIKKPASDVNYKLVNALPFVSINQNGLISFQPTNKDVGSYSIAVSISSATYTELQYIGVKVQKKNSSINTAPIFEPLEAIDLSVETVTTLKVNSLDNEEDKLSFWVENNPKWLTINEFGVLRFAPKRSDSGRYSADVFVSDGEFVTTQTIEIVVNVPNVAPQIAPIGPINLTELKALTIKVAVKDEQSYLNYSLVRAPSWVTITQDGLLKLAPSRSDKGVYRFQVRVSDGELASQVTVKATVNLVNLAPVISPIGDLSITDAEATTVQLHVKDDETDLEYSVLNGPAWVSVTRDGLLKLSPSRSDKGVYRFQVKVSDGELASQVTVNAIVNLVNLAPVIAPIDELNITDAKTTSVQLHVKDDEADLKYSVLNGPTWVSVTQGGLLKLSPSRCDKGVYRFQVKVSDGELASQVTVNATVKLVNLAPVISPIGDLSITDAKTTSVQLHVKDDEADLKYSVLNGPTWVSVTQGGLLKLAPSRSDKGVYRFQVRVSDGELASQVTVKATVNLVNLAPVISPIGDLTITDAEATTVQLHVKDDEVALEYSVLNGPTWVSVTQGGLLKLAPSRSDKGVYRFQVRVSDGELASQVTVNATVNLVNLAPVISPIGDLTITDAETTTVQLNVKDDETALEYSVLNGPTWVSVTQGGLLKLAPSRSDKGVYRFQVRVSDGELASQVNINVEVVPANTAPLISTSSLPQGIVGEQFRSQILATDEEGSTLTYTVANAPSWLKVDENTGVLFGEVTQEFVGSRMLTLIVSDGEALTEKSVQLEVISKTVSNSYNDRTTYEISSTMIPPQGDVLDVVVIDQEAIAKKQIVRFDDIVFKKINDEWVIVNNTFFPIETLVVKSNEVESPFVISLSSVLEPYSQAKIGLSATEHSGLRYVNGGKMFLPNVTLAGDNSCDTAPVDKTCYESPETKSERETHERTLAYFYLSYNRYSYLSRAEKYFEENCASIAPCSDYEKAFPDALSYGYKGYLTIGQQGHNYAAKVMRNVYAAEGMGGGLSSSLKSLTNSYAFGWASVWSEYLDDRSPYYNALPMWILSHEIGHANGYDHSSGWTYGFPEDYSLNYLPSLMSRYGWEQSKKPNLEMPGIIVNTTYVPHGVRLQLANLERGSSKKVIKFRLGSNSKFSFKTSEQNIDNKNAINFEFDVLPVDPVFMHIWTEDSDYMATIKFDKIMISESLKYIVGNKEFTIIDPELIPQSANGWDIRDVCRNDDGTELATRSQYQELFDYMYKNNELKKLKLRSFLTKDEPQDYLIWNVYFEDTRMNAWYSGMVKPIGSDRGLVCVKPL